MAMQLNFYSHTEGCVHPLSLSITPLTPFHWTSHITGVSNPLPFLLGFFMLFPLTFHSASNELQSAHGEEQRYSFDDYGESFGRRVNLRSHQRMHIGEEPFGCHVCNKSFSQQVYLKRHKDIHIGDRLFCCEVCNMSFRHRGKLKTH
jgi:uncharacterized Zn-finger protein